MTLKNYKPIGTIVFYMLFILLILISCKKKHHLTSFKISHKLPTDVSSDAAQEELAYFAWQEFFALNWKSSWNENLLRATPVTVAQSHNSEKYNLKSGYQRSLLF